MADGSHITSARIAQKTPLSTVIPFFACYAAACNGCFSGFTVLALSKYATICTEISDPKSVEVSQYTVGRCKLSRDQPIMFACEVMGSIRKQWLDWQCETRIHMHCIFIVCILLCITKTKLRGFSPQANRNNRATAACL
jgi:hypothetical protein